MTSDVEASKAFSWVTQLVLKFGVSRGALSLVTLLFLSPSPQSKNNPYQLKLEATHSLESGHLLSTDDDVEEEGLTTYNPKNNCPEVLSNRGVQEPVPYCSPGMWDLLEGLAESCPSRPPSSVLSCLLFHPLFRLPPAPPHPSWGHFLMPFLNLAPIPPKAIKSTT